MLKLYYKFNFATEPFIIIFGILMQIKLEYFWEVIGILLVSIGLVFLSVQLDQDSHTAKIFYNPVIYSLSININCLFCCWFSIQC